jgi:hypothetical protein
LLHLFSSSPSKMKTRICLSLLRRIVSWSFRPTVGVAHD